MRAKFDLVCSCQVYGRHRKATDVKRRWLAESVNIMLQVGGPLKPRLVRAVLSFVLCWGE